MSSASPRFLRREGLGPPAPLAAYSWGFLGGAFAIAAELAWVVSRHAAELTGLWELQHGILGLGPAWLLLALPASLWGTSCGVCASAPQSRPARWGFVGLVAVFAALVAYGVGGGRHLATLGARATFAAATASAAGLGSYALFPRWAQWWNAGGVRSVWGLGLALLLVALGCAALNRVLLVRLYPAFHAGLSFIEIAMVALLASRFGYQRARRGMPLLVLVLLALAALALPAASRMARGFDNFRWLVSEASPTLAWGVELASSVAPPEPLEVELNALPLGARRRASGVDFRGRSVLLLTIDALRADHLGAYGATRGASPRIDALARQGVVFDAAYAATPHTSYSLSSLMTGKYMRPLLLQGAGADSDLWPELLRTYGYRTAAFYPPAVFFIDSERFAAFRDRQFGFEYAKVEFAEGAQRIEQVTHYLSSAPTDKPLFLWVHLFGPHEPYEQKERDFGPRDVDRYDSEVASADATTGAIVDLFRERDPQAVVIVSADHGEEFGDHGGRYHGTSVYDEQVRVPLIVAGPGLTAGWRVTEPVQTIDLFPTVLAGLGVPIPPRIRGRDLGPVLVPAQTSSAAALPGARPSTELGRAMAETDDYVLLAEGHFRLICARRSGACQLFDTTRDPQQAHDIGLGRPDVLEAMRSSLRSLSASHGAYETRGLRSEGKGWPSAILRGLSGDAEVAPELGHLLDDADVSIRRKSAELLFRLHASGQAAALRLAASREEDAIARRFVALALTRTGQGAPLVREMLRDESPEFRRLAALALAEQGDAAGEEQLIDWWLHPGDLEFEQARELLEAFGTIRSKSAVGPLVSRLGDVRLRPHIARVLARIGDEDARPALLEALAEERYVSARLPLANALLSLGAHQELAAPLARFLGVPDPLEGGLALALDARVLALVGGPSELGLARLRQLGDSGVQIDVTVPYVAKQGARGTRLVALVRGPSGPSTLLVGLGTSRRPGTKEEATLRRLPDITSGSALRLAIPAGPDPVQVAADVPASWGARPGQRVALDVFVDNRAQVLALALVPLRDELPPPLPEPWEKAKVRAP